MSLSSTDHSMIPKYTVFWSTYKWLLSSIYIMLSVPFLTLRHMCIHLYFNAPFIISGSGVECFRWSWYWCCQGKDLELCKHTNHIQIRFQASYIGWSRCHDQWCPECPKKRWDNFLLVRTVVNKGKAVVTCMRMKEGGGRFCVQSDTKKKKKESTCRKCQV